MGEVIQVTRDLTEPYNRINVYRNKGSASFCGCGARERDEETDLDKTYFMTAYPISSSGGRISHVRFRTGTVTDAAASIKVGFFSQVTTGDDIVYFAERTLAAPHDGVGWVSDTFYTVELETSIAFPGALQTRYYLSFYSPDPGVPIACSADSGEQKGWVENGDSFIVLGPITPATAHEVSVSFEAWGQPAAWQIDLKGGAIAEPTEDWFGTEEGDFTFLAGDLTNIETDGPVVLSAGNGSYVAVDLANGQVPGAIEGEEDDFPDYSSTGVRAIRSIHVTGEMIDADGILAVLVSREDSVTLPGVGADWENIGYIKLDVAGLFDETIPIPTLGRWIKIVEASDVTPGDILLNQLSVEIITTAVDDGEYPVDHADVVHPVWVNSTPIEDTLYRCCFKNSYGATSPFSEQITNRMYRD
ncbi:MAG: hypothetical protein WC455_09650 [Dehalococcoidia bacterium]|jgi:hypothetical protein